MVKDISKLMMRTAPLVLAACMALPVASIAGGSNGVEVSEGWARGFTARTDAGAAYVTIHNHTAGDRLIAVETPVAEEAFLRAPVEQNGRTDLVAQTDMAVPGSTVTRLHPRGTHIMLKGLKHHIKLGEIFPVTLTFERAGPVRVNVVVHKPGGAAGKTVAAR